MYARTLFYPQAWLFEPLSCAYTATALTSPRTALPSFLEAVKLRGKRRMGGVGKKWLALDHLNPDLQHIWSATLSLIRNCLKKKKTGSGDPVMFRRGPRRHDLWKAKCQADASLNLGKIRIAQAARFVANERGIKRREFGPHP